MTPPDKLRASGVFYSYKNDISLFILKPTVTTFNIFYLKVIIFKYIIDKNENILF